MEKYQPGDLTPIIVVPAELHRPADYVRCRSMRATADFIDRADKYARRHRRDDPHVIVLDPHLAAERQRKTAAAHAVQTVNGWRAGMRFSGGGETLAIC
jgi:hypothetical protein